MKLRLNTNAIRLRLTRDEVDTISRGESVRVAIPFPDGRTFRYVLVVVPSGALSATMDCEGMVISLPASDAARWTGSDAVSIDTAQAMDGASVRILIEKDFACLHPRQGEDQVGTFPNPEAPPS